MPTVLEAIGYVIAKGLASSVENGKVIDFEGIDSLAQLDDQQQLRWLAIRWKWDTCALTLDEANLSQDEVLTIARASTLYFDELGLPISLDYLKRAEQVFETARLSESPHVNHNLATRLLIAYYIQDVLDLDKRVFLNLKGCGMAAIDNVLQNEHQRSPLNIDILDLVGYSTIMDSHMKRVIAVINQAREM